MAIALEIIPASMHENGHTEDVDHEIHIVRNYESAKEVFDTEARKLVAPYDSEFMGWITDPATQQILANNLPDHHNAHNRERGVRRASTDRDIAGFRYILTEFKPGKHSANSNM